MITKVIIFVAGVVAVNAKYLPHGQATSSLSITRHDVSHNQHGYSHVPPLAAQAVQHVAPTVQHHPSNEHKHYHAHPSYEFEYSVADPHTGDIKSHQETRDGDRVSGSYSLLEADGSVRTVYYTADAHSGFKARVEHSRHSHHAQPVEKHVQPTVQYFQPAVRHV